MVRRKTLGLRYLQEVQDSFIRKTVDVRDIHGTPDVRPARHVYRGRVVRLRALVGVSLEIENVSRRPFGQYLQGGGWEELESREGFFLSEQLFIELVVGKHLRISSIPSGIIAHIWDVHPPSIRHEL